MQRLFSTFAGGWPGRGLLLQRLLAAGVLVHCLVAQAGQTLPAISKASYIVAACAGILLLLGLWTPFAGSVLAAAELMIIISHPENPWLSLTLLGLGLTLAMIGPGAWSIDALLFGRKQIDI